MTMPDAQAPAPTPAPQGPPQTPIGSSPATGPTQNLGMQAHGLQAIAVSLRILEAALPHLGSSSEVGKDVIRAISTLSKHVDPGAISQVSEKNQLQSLAMKQQQMGPQVAAMRASQGASSPAPSPMAA